MVSFTQDFMGRSTVRSKNVGGAGKFGLLEDVGQVSDFRDFKVLLCQRGEIRFLYHHNLDMLRCEEFRDGVFHLLENGTGTVLDVGWRATHKR